MEKKLESMLTAILEAEAEARKILETAEKEAKELRDRTRKETEQLVEQVRSQEGREMQNALKQAKDQGDSIRKKLLEDAEKEIQHWNELYNRNSNKAINFVIENIISDESR